MNKAQLVEALASAMSDRGADVTKALAGEFLASLEDVVTQYLANNPDDALVLPGIGRFSTKTRAARAGRNPKTGESVDVPAMTLPKFTAAKSLKQALNPHL